MIYVQALTGHILTGAMTYSFIQAAENEPGLTYGRLLGAMRSTIREAKSGRRGNGPILSLINKILRTELSQVYNYLATLFLDRDMIIIIIIILSYLITYIIYLMN